MLELDDAAQQTRLFLRDMMERGDMVSTTMTSGTRRSGLEFPLCSHGRWCVFAAPEEIDAEDNIDEEWRLVYVGITSCPEGIDLTLGNGQYGEFPRRA